MYAYITGTQTIKVVTKSVKTSCNIRKSLAPMHSTPAKCSNNSSADENDEEFVDDPSFHISKESFDTTTDMEVEGEPKEPIEEHFIVSKSCLWKLLGVCPKCCNACSIDIANRNGTFISVDRKCCQCEHNSRWDSQQFVKNQPVGNIILAAGIHFNGASPTKVLRLLETMRIPSPCYTSYWKLQTTLLQPCTMRGKSHKLKLLSCCVRSMDLSKLQATVVRTVLAIVPNLVHTLSSRPESRK